MPRGIGYAELSPTLQERIDKIGSGGSSGLITTSDIEDSAVTLDKLSTDVKEELESVKTSVSDGKSEIASAITDKGGTATGSDTFTELAAAIAAIKVGAGNAVASQVLSGYTFTNASGNLLTGTIPTSDVAATITPTTTDNKIIEKNSYVNKDVTVEGDASLVAGNIKAGASIFSVEGSFTGNATATAARILKGYTAGVNGSMITGTIESKAAATYSPSTTAQTIASGQYLSGAQTIAATTGTANTGHVLSGYTFNSANGIGLRGTIASKNAATYNPSTTAQSIAGGQYLAGAQTIAAVTGTATAADVVKGKTFSSASGINLTGTITGKAAATYNPSNTEQVISGGQYLEGAQTIAAVGGTAKAADVIKGKTFSSSEGVDLVGTIDGKEAATYQPSTTAQVIASGQMLIGDQTIAPVTGTARPQSVAAGYTFSSASGINQTGTMDVMDSVTPYADFMDGFTGETEIRVGITPGAYVSAGENELDVPEITIPYSDLLDKMSLTASDIKVGKTVLGVAGTFTNDATITAARVLSGYTGYANGNKITGTIASKSAATYNPSTTAQTIAAGQYLGGAQTIAATTGTANIGQVLSGYTFNSANGIGLTGTIASKTAATYSPSIAAQTIASGQYLSGVQTIAATTGTADAADVLSGKTFNSANGIGLTGTIASKAAATYTPGTSNQTIAAGQYLSGVQTISGSANLVADNIKTGVNIFGVAGTYTSDATATAASILEGSTAYVNGEKIEGSIGIYNTETISIEPSTKLRALNKGIYLGGILRIEKVEGTANSNTVVEGYTFSSANGINLTGAIPSLAATTYTPGTSNQRIEYRQFLSGAQTILGSSNLKAANIKSGVNIFNVVGTLDPNQPHPSSVLGRCYDLLSVASSSGEKLKIMRIGDVVYYSTNNGSSYSSITLPYSDMEGPYISGGTTTTLSGHSFIYHRFTSSTHYFYKSTSISTTPTQFYTCSGTVTLSNAWGLSSKGVIVYTGGVLRLVNLSGSVLANTTVESITNSSEAVSSICMDYGNNLMNVWCTSNNSSTSPSETVYISGDGGSTFATHSLSTYCHTPVVKSDSTSTGVYLFPKPTAMGTATVYVTAGSSTPTLVGTMNVRVLGVVYDQDIQKFVGYAAGTSPGTVYTSPDGITWTATDLVAKLDGDLYARQFGHINTNIIAGTAGNSSVVF